MVFKYIFKNFTRRKVRTILMILSLVVSTGLIVSMSATVETVRRSNVDLISTTIGRYDLDIRKTDTSPDPFIEIEDNSQRILAADERITAVHPRFVTEVELSANGEQAAVTLIARQPDENIGQLEVISGTLDFANNGVALFDSTANNFGVSLGDTISIAYSFPQPREEGEAVVLGLSQRRVVGEFPVTALVRQTGVVNAGVNDGLVMDFEAAQNWLGLPNRAGHLIGLVDPALYESANAEDGALEVRQIGIQVQEALGEEYDYALSKANILDQSAEAFLVLQALINTYGVMSLGIVGLLIHTLVMTNVQEQRRDMAVLRILGSQRNYLFTIVMAEVAIIGVIGVGFGVVFGQWLMTYAIVPFIEWQISNEGLTVTIVPSLSIPVILPSVIAAFVVLFLSALKPAQDAAKTKVMYAINPGVADNIQLEDLEDLREQRPNVRFFVIGIVLLITASLVLGLDVVSTLGIPALEATIFLGTVLLMVLGIGLVFLIITRPLERLILAVIGLIAPRMAYFAKRNVGRSNKRNALISLLVLFSGVLPSFLATQNAINEANIETDVRLDMGAPIEMRIFTRFEERELAELDWLQPSFLDSELATVDGVDQSVGLTWDYNTQASDAVNMRNSSVSVIGVTNNLNDVVFTDMMIFTAGDPRALGQIVTDDEGIIISESLAESLAVSTGDTLKINGEGLDHVEEMTVIGVVRRLPGFDNILRARPRASGSTVLVSLNSFHRLTTNLNQALPADDSPALDRVLAAVSPNADPQEVDAALRSEFGLRNRMWTRVAEVRLQQAQDERFQTQIFLLVMTLISFTTAVFGVFAVIYVTIYARRLEIGMMKAVGTRNWELTSMLTIESIAMALSAALAGIIAGAAMGYVFAYLDNITAERPMLWALDTTVMPFVMIMVVIASIVGTIFSARRIIKYRAVEILRMS